MMQIRETARQHHRDTATSIEQVPEFRAYLKENGLRNLDEWRKHFASSKDLDTQSLELRRRRLALKSKK